MKLVGIVETLSSFIFAISSSMTASRIDVYTETLEGSEARLDPRLLNTKLISQYNDYLLGSAIISKTGKITKASGNIGITTTVLNTLVDSEKFIDLLSGEMQPDTYVLSNCTLKVISVNYSISSATCISGQKYEPISKPVTAKQLVAGLTKNNLKTFNEVVSERDMSWYYNSDGSCKKDYVLVQSLEELQELMNDAAKYEYIAFDTETTGTDFYWFQGDASKRSKICGMSLSWRKDQGIYIPFMSEVFASLDLDEAMSLVYPVLKSKKVICHNGMFDFKVLYSYGYYIPISHDTLLIEFNIDPHVQKGMKGLKTLTRKYLNHETIELEELTGGRVLADLIPYIDSELIKIYACSDSDYTLQLFNLLYPYVSKMQSYKLDCMLIDILAIAEYQGAPINMSLLTTMSQINKKNMEIVEHVMQAYIKLVGTQTLAIRAIQGVKQDDSYIPETNEVLQLCKHEKFLESIQGAFTKQIAGHKGEPLQFSSSADINYIMYDLLGYPVVKTNDSGSRTSDKEAISKLLEFSAVETIPFLKEDILTCAPEFGVKSTDVIVSKSKFESYMYPFAYLLSIWRKLQKFDSSFFSPLLADSNGGYYYTDNSMTSAETARVINKIQTLEGSLKELVVPRNDDWYMIVFDKSQIEFRVMLGLAANYWNSLVDSGAFTGSFEELARSKDLTGLIENLNNWEKDYHREGGAIFAGCTPDTMTKKQRKSVKAIHFSVPYGAEAASVAKPKLAGHPESEYPTIIAETEAELAAWRDKLYPLYYFLEHVRDKALEPIETNPPGHYGVYGKVTNALGRYRLFDLSDDSFAAKSSIRRQAGNYPIQSLARDIFFSGIYKLFSRLKSEGLITDKFETSKVVLSLFVHDEVVIQVHKSIHPYRMYKYIMETNLTKLKGHPTYFMGIAVTDTWGKGKTDSYEAPIAYVKACIHEYENNKEFYDTIEDRELLASLDYTKLCWDGITDWFAKRACQELAKTLAGNTVIDPVYIYKNLINYYVKPRLGFYSKPCRKARYKIDNSIDSESNAYIQLFDYYLLHTGDYKKYSLLFNGEIIPYEEVLDMHIDEDTGLDDFDIMSDLDFLSEMTDMQEDNMEKEQQYADEYYLCQEQSLAVSLKKRMLQDEDDDKADAVPKMWSEDSNGRIVFFISAMNTAQYKKLIAFLKPYITKEGKPLYFFTKQLIDAKVNITITFSNEQIYNAVYGEDTETTSYFGG